MRAEEEPCSNRRERNIKSGDETRAGCGCVLQPDGLKDVTGAEQETEHEAASKSLRSEFVRTRPDDYGKYQPSQDKAQREKDQRRHELERVLDQRKSESPDHGYSEQHQVRSKHDSRYAMPFTRATHLTA